VFGVFGIFAAIWVFVEVLNVSERNLGRIRMGSILTAVFMVLTWIVGGYWYVHFYAADKAIILAGPWPVAHTFFMEAKEHVFFGTLVLSLLLPIVVRFENLMVSRNARILVLCIVALIGLSALFIEGAGSMIALGVKLGLMNSAAQ